jgi:drug/metabolite transporter (DMT)-like permease
MTAAARLDRPMNLSEWGLLITLSVVWGGSFFFNGLAVKELPALLIVTCRVGLAAIILGGVLATMRIRLPLSRATLTAFFGMGLLNNVIPFTLIVWGQSHIGAGLAAILNATTPLFSVLIAHLMTIDDKMRPRRLVGVLAGLAGVAVMVGPSVMGGIGANLMAQIAVLGAAVSYGFAFVFGRRFKQLGVPPLGTACGQLSASAIMLLPLTLLVDAPWHLGVPGIATIAALVASAALSTALAYVVYFRLLATAGATNLSLVTLLVPVSALMLGVLILGEHLEVRQALGMGLIALGLAAMDGRALVWIRQRHIYRAFTSQ